MRRTVARFLVRSFLFFAFSGLLACVDAAPLSFAIKDLGPGRAFADCSCIVGGGTSLSAATFRSPYCTSNTR